MADELVFPASNTLSLIDDLASSMMNEEILAHDINPSFPQNEGSIDIPEIIPPIICPKDTNTTFNQAASETYRPISQLMKDTGELSAPLNVPLTTNINEPMNYSNLQNNSRQHIQSPLANNSINFVNPNSHVSPLQNVQNTHCLVIGGQRVPISTPSQHNSSVINIKHAPNANSSLLQTTQAMHSSSNVGNVENKLKQTMMTAKAPMNEHMNIPNKPPMKGQIIKTPDQRLMFVTEVNGRRVGYLIQQPKQNNSPNNISPNNIPPQNNVPSPNNIPAQNNSPNNTHFSRVQASVQSFVNEHLENKKNQNNLSSVSSETTNRDNQIKSSSPINFTLDENKEIIMRHSENVTKTTEPLLKTDMKSLREKLLNLRNPLNSKNQLNSKPLSFPSIQKPEEKSGDEYAVHTDNAPSPPTLPLDSPIPIQTVPSDSTIEDTENSNSNEIVSQNDHEGNNIEMQEEEEEGQEIEFSENDLTAEIDDGTDQSCSPDYEMGDGDVNEQENTTAEIRSRATSTDDEDSVPLSMLKIDTIDNCLSPTSEGGQVESPSSKTKKGKNSKKVKADGKSTKKEGKPKVKKKKDSRKPKKPTIAYQLFFRDIQKDVRLENPQSMFGEVSKLVSKKWEILEEGEKKKYFDEHENLKAEYAEKMKAYKELIAQEQASCPESALSPVLEEITSNQAEDKKDHTPPKKKGKRGKKRKLVDSLKNDLGNELSVEAEQLDVKDKKHELQHELQHELTTQDKPDLDDNPPSSPSLPSSSSPSSDDDEDSQSAITRIRQKAAELHKILKQQHIVTKKKTKTSAKKVRPPKIEVKELPVEDDTKDEKSEKKVEDGLDTPDDITEMEETIDQKEDVSKDLKQGELESPNEPNEAEAKEVTDNGEEVLINNTPSDESDLMETDDHLMENNVEPVIMKDEFVDHVSEDTEHTSDVEEEPIKTKSKEDSENDDLSDEEVISSLRRKKSPRIKKIEESSPSGSEKSKKGRDSKKTKSKEDSENDDLSDDDVFSSSRRKKSQRIKKIEENVPASEEKSRKGRNRKMEDESDEEESTRSRRSKSKKKIDYTEKSDSEEESDSKEKTEDLNSNNKNSETNANEKEKIHDNDKDLPTVEDLPSPRKDPRKAEKAENGVQPMESDIKPSTNDTSKNEEIKPAVEQSSIKNTFRIPKKSGSTNDSGLLALRGPRICIRQSCDKPAVTSRERGGQYCGNECLVLYCREVFEAWVIDRGVEETKT